MPGNRILHEINEKNRYIRGYRGLFKHNVARHTARGHRHPEDRANASELAAAAINRYDDRHGLTRRALPAMKYQPMGKFKLDREGQIALRTAERAHRAIELDKKRAENARRLEGQKLAQKAAKNVNRDVDNLADLFGKNLGFKGGRRTRRRHRRHRTRRSTRA